MTVAAALRTWTPARVILLAPVVFLLHVAEEAPRFVAWFNALVEPDITTRLFLTVNASGLVVTLLATAFLAVTQDRIAVFLAVGWLSFLMLANGVFHLVATAVHGYSPGTVTAAVLYLPFYAWFVGRVVAHDRPHPVALFLTIVLGALPMAIHGYRIVFEGGRLF
jgi:hypothetical protein